MQHGARPSPLLDILAFALLFPSLLLIVLDPIVVPAGLRKAFIHFTSDLPACNIPCICTCSASWVRRRSTWENASKLLRGLLVPFPLPPAKAVRRPPPEASEAAFPQDRSHAPEWTRKTGEMIDTEGRKGDRFAVRWNTVPHAELN
jgi:hypothetical protein